MASQESQNPTQTDKKRRIQFSNEERKKVRKKYHDHPTLTQQQLALWASNELRRHIDQYHISRILSNKYKNLDDDHFNASQKRVKSAHYPSLEAAIASTVFLYNERHIVVTGDVIKDIARQLWTKMPCFFEKEMPTFSNGWLEGFKARFKIHQYINHGDAASVRIQDCLPRIRELRAIIARYELYDVFNWDESALFWRMVPNRTLANQRRPGRKLQKVRLTLNFCCNADGTEKVDLVFVDTAKEPVSFHGKNIENFPMRWWHQTSAWMDTKLSKKFIIFFWQQTYRRGRKVLLILDNLRAHTKAVKELKEENHRLFDSIRIEFLPENSTSTFQPLDQGIIQSFKLKYRAKWLKFYSWEARRDKDPCKEVTKYHVMRWACHAWQQVDGKVLASCWRRSQLLDIEAPIGEEASRVQDSVVEDTTKVDLEEVTALIQDIVPDAVERQPVQDFISHPEEKIVDNEDPIQAAVDEFGGLSLQDQAEENQEDIPVQELVSSTAALEALRLLTLYEEQQQDGNIDLLRELYKAERSIKARGIERVRQSTITEFFKT